MNPEKKNLALSPEAVKVIEDILKRRNHAEVKIEDGSVVIIEIHRKKRI
jgi:hypothetical protein|nr:MAG TPA: hypothetical protein [Bacteriophage sp.]